MRIMKRRRVGEASEAIAFLEMKNDENGCRQGLVRVVLNGVELHALAATLASFADAAVTHEAMTSAVARYLRDAGAVEARRLRLSS